MNTKTNLLDSVYDIQSVQQGTVREKEKRALELLKKLREFDEAQQKRILDAVHPAKEQ